MRGLTAAERDFLADATGSPTAGEAEASDYEWYRVLPCLIAHGRAIADSRCNPEFNVALTTDLGRLALRVCPVDES